MQILKATNDRTRNHLSFEVTRTGFCVRELQHWGGETLDGFFWKGADLVEALTVFYSAQLRFGAHGVSDRPLEQKEITYVKDMATLAAREYAERCELARANSWPNG